MSCLPWFACLAALAGTAVGQSPKAAPDKQLADAIAEMRHIAPRDFAGEALAAKSQRLDAAWDTLIAAKDAGAAALLAEVASLDRSGEKDDYFRLEAGAVLFKIGGLDRAADIAHAWNAVADFSVNYNSPFLTAFTAATSGDARAAVLLRPLLRDRAGKYFLEKHAMTLDWPVTQVVLWGVLGRKALDPLVQVLGDDKDPAAQVTALVLLGNVTHAPALPAIRRLAKSGQGEARKRAIETLGLIGHPDDYDALIAGLADKDPVIVWASVNALYEYEDLRAVPKLLPLADTKDPDLKSEVLAAIGHLATPEGLGKLGTMLPHADGAVRGAFDGQVMPALRSVSVTWKAFSALPPADAQAVLIRARAKAEEEFVLRADDRKLSHDEFLKAAQDWIARSRITGGDYSWVETRHVLSAATAADVPLLLDVRAACLSRLSDECLDEAKTIDGMVRRLVRAGLRSEPGICDRVQPPGPKPK